MPELGDEAGRFRILDARTTTIYPADLTIKVRIRHQANNGWVVVITLPDCIAQLSMKAASA